MLIKSGQPEILRAAQRDETFLRQFHDTLTEILQGVLGVRKWIRFKEWIKIVSDLTYYCFTTLSNVQTLGEEYTGIFQTHSSRKSLQPKHVQILMILLNCCGEKVLIESLRKFEKYINDLPRDHPLQIQAREKLIKTSTNLRNVIPFFQRLHKAMFYLNGDYYDCGKRITSTKYVLVRHWLKNKSTLPAFRLLGIVSFIHLTLYALLTGFRLKNNSVKQVWNEKVTTNEFISSQNRCPLCLNARKDTSAISCGHLFCWECIISWLQEQPQCPLCRKMVQPSRVVFLQNF